MTTKSAQEITNLVSILSVLFGFVVLVSYWSDLSLIKKLLLIIFISLFIYLILKNSPLRGRLQTNKYFTIDSVSNRRPTHVNDTLDKLEGFMSGLSERNEPDFFEEKKRQTYNSGMYMQERRQAQQPQQTSYYSQYLINSNNKFSLLSKPSSQLLIDHTNGIRLFIPQNLTAIFEQIKKKVSPKKYLNSFCQSIDNLRLPKREQQKSTLADIYYHPSSLVLNDNNKLLLLEKDHDVMIIDEKYCAEAISEFLQSGLSTILTEIQTHFRNVSQILMKTFGMKINFNLTQTHPNDFDPSRDIILDELTQLIKCWRTKTTLPPKFLPQVPMNQFASIHYTKLEKSAEIVCKFVEFTKSDEEMTFRLYVQVLNAEFRDDKVFVRDNLSVLSEQMRKVKHVFLFHKVQNDVSYTYNRIRRFITTNPLVAIMAYFAVDFATNFQRNNRISKQLKRFFKQKSRLTAK